MNIIEKIILKLRIEWKYLTEQKWGIVKPSDPFAISKSILKKYLPANPVIVDCGAHIGADSVELARILPGSRVHAFEPVPAVFAFLSYNTRKYAGITCYPIALSDQNGEMTMYVSSGASNASSSLLAPTAHKDDHPDVLFNETIHVQTRTLDRWAEENNIPKVDFLWLDMQGYELQMLKASEKILPNVTAVYTEVSMKETYKNACLYKEVKSWMESKGFTEVFKVFPDAGEMGNVLFQKLRK